MVDYHIHTNHSIDADGSCSEYCERALSLGLKEVCFTNHCELDPKRDDNLIRIGKTKLPLTAENLGRLGAEISKITASYKKRGLIVRFGLEVGFYDGIKSRLKDVTGMLELDFLIAGIHCLDHVCIDSSKEYESYFKKYKAGEVLTRYYHEVGKLAGHGLFDALAHLDVYKKYGIGFYGNQIRKLPEDALRAIFKQMAGNGLALEINTAGLRRVNEFYPSAAIMKMAREEGLEFITIGSDCHKVDDLGKGIKEGIEFVKSFGYKAVYGFEKRKPIRINI